MAGAGVAAVGLPQLTESALGAPLGSGDKILVTVRLEGGNDGLNTLIPVNNGRYRDLRGALALPAGGTHSVGDGLHLHPALGRLKNRFDSGDVAIVRGVGEPNLDHSHFSCIAKWMSARNSGIARNGWLGRYLDTKGSDVFGGVSVGTRTLPLHMKRANGDVVNLPTFPQLFGAPNGRPEEVPMYRNLSGLANSPSRSKWAKQIADSQQSAIDAAQRMTPVYSPEIPAPAQGTDIVRDLELAARVINMNVGARVLNVSFGDFDTHDNQLGPHNALLSALDLAIEKFFASLSPTFRDRVVLMTFSEFGRRPEANGSAGVDHGTSSCLFVCGSGVTGGLYGQQPALAANQLDSRGDLKVHVDYRSVYATVLDNHLKADSRAILGGRYENLGFFGQAPTPPPTTTPTTLPAIAAVTTTTRPKAAPTTTTAKPKQEPVLRCNGQKATIVGTDGNDRLIGTPGRDVIVGGKGDDFIAGRGGNDLICGGSGNDVLRGGRGRDTILGNRGRDTINGQSGKDRTAGGPGLDRFVRQAIDFFNRQ